MEWVRVTYGRGLFVQLGNPACLPLDNWASSPGTQDHGRHVEPRCGRVGGHDRSHLGRRRGLLLLG